MLMSKTPKALRALANMVIGGEKPAQHVQQLIVQQPRLEVAEAGRPEQGTVKVIKDEDAIPKGRYVPFSELGIPASSFETFAFVEVRNGELTLLVAEEEHWTHTYHGMRQRLRSAGYTDAAVSTSVLSRELIKLLHNANRDEAQTERTDLEKKGFAMINDAIYQGASDIHLEAVGGSASIIFRIHGVRIKQGSLTMDTAMELCSVLYGMHGGGESDWDPKKVLDTTIAHRVREGLEVQLRWSSVPRFPNGISVVMRIIRLDIESFRRLNDVGYTTGQLAMVRKMLRGGSGLLILVGPTNSGKSSAMQSLVEELYEMRGRLIKIQTAEDPVEYIMPSAVQGNAGGTTSYSSLVKSMLRQDNDYVMVGEVRDAESAENVKTLALSGRKVLTTLHVFEASAAFARLRELGVPESVLFMKGFISGIICQRLVPVLCPHCSVPIVDAAEKGLVTQELVDRVGRVASFAEHNVRIRCVGGCDKCKHVGIIGRTPVGEMLAPTQKYIDYVKAGDFDGANAYWHEQAASLDIDGNGVNMMAHAIHKMRAGLVCPMDIEAALSDIEVERSAYYVNTPRSAPLPAQDYVLPPTMSATEGVMMESAMPRMVGHAELERGDSVWNGAGR